MQNATVENRPDQALSRFANLRSFFIHFTLEPATIEGALLAGEQSLNDIGPGVNRIGAKLDLPETARSKTHRVERGQICRPARRWLLQPELTWPPRGLNFVSAPSYFHRGHHRTRPVVDAARLGR